MLIYVMSFLKQDGSHSIMFTEENEPFDDNMIVEFQYIHGKEKGWNWVPLRVRYDKQLNYVIIKGILVMLTTLLMQIGRQSIILSVKLYYELVKIFLNNHPMMMYIIIVQLTKSHTKVFVISIIYTSKVI